MEPSPPQNVERDFRPKRKFTPLSESIYNILRKLCDYKIITLPNIRLNISKTKESRWYNESEFCHHHRQKGHDTYKYRTLNNVVQDLIDNEKLEVDNPIIIPDQNLGLYQNLLPQNPTNNISLHLHEN